MQSPFAQTAETESTGTGLAVPLGDPKQVFKLGGTLPFIKAVQEHVASLKPQLDISTKEGRSFIASTAYKIARTKTFAYAKAKELSSVYKAMGKEIDDEAEAMAKELDKLKHETRRPLTEWEDRDKERAGKFETMLGEIYNSCLFVGGPTSDKIKDRMSRLMELQSIDWAEYAERAQQGFRECVPVLQEMLRKAFDDENDKRELEELRALKAEQLGRTPIPVKELNEKFGKPDGEAIPPCVVADPKLQVEIEIAEDLASILDYDQVTDVIDSIKAGKIRHMQIVY